MNFNVSVLTGKEIVFNNVIYTGGQIIEVNASQAESWILAGLGWIQGDVWPTLPALNYAGATGNLPSASYQVDSQLYTLAGGTLYAVAVADSSGNINLNIIPMTNTTAVLETVAGAQGLIATATDTETSWIYSGVGTKAAVAFSQNYTSKFGCSSAFSSSTTSLANPSLSFINHVTVPPPGQVLDLFVGFTSAASEKYVISFDGFNWRQPDLLPSSHACNYATDGTFILATPTAASNTLCTLIAPPYSLANQTPVTLPSGTWVGTAINSGSYLGGGMFLITPKSSVSSSYLGIISELNSSLTPVALPAVGNWYAPSVNSYNFGNEFAMLFCKDNVNYVLINGPNQTAYNLIAPSSMNNQQIYMTADKVFLIGTATTGGATKGYVADVADIIASFATTAVVTWSDISASLPVSTVTSYFSNKNLLFANGPTPSSSAITYYFTRDGILWNDFVDVNLLSTSVLNKCNAIGPLLKVNGGNDLGAFDPSALSIDDISNNTSNVLASSNGIIIGTDSTNLLKSIAYNRQLAPNNSVTSTATGTINIKQDITWLISNPGSTQSALTINLPPLPWDGMKIYISFSSIVTALTIGTQAAPSGQSINGAPTSAIAGLTVEAKYDMYTNSWWFT